MVYSCTHMATVGINGLNRIFCIVKCSVSAEKKTVGRITYIVLMQT